MLGALSVRSLGGEDREGDRTQPAYLVEVGP